MDEPPDLESRVTALEGRIEEVAADAAAARHLASARDRDLADFAIKIDANRSAINALGQQLGGRITGVENRLGGVENRLDGVENRLDGVENRLGSLELRVDAGFAEVGAAFAEVRGRLDGAAAGQQTIVALLTRLIDTPEAG